MKKVLTTLLVSLCTAIVFAQSYDSQVQQYIEQFKNVAIDEQLRSGIPASITLAQGILETGAGTSELCVNAQNHFGIKCKNTWAGDTYTYTDDAKDECFRRYHDALTSYKDHSDFLKQNKRYAALFFIPVEDYASWAKGLKRCGYATNPQYAFKLIETIEKYNLEQFTDVAVTMNQTANGNPQMLASADKNATAGEYVPDERVSVPLDKLDEKIGESQSGGSDGKPDDIEYYTVTKRNGLNGFYARQGDMLLEYAIKNHVRYSKLLEMNDLFDEPLKKDMFIYLEKKNRSGQDDTYTVKEGETLADISQEQGMQLQSLRSYNKLEPGEEPMPGSTLYLKSSAPQKPNIYSAGAYETVKSTAIEHKVGGSNDYVETVKTTETPRKDIADAKADVTEDEFARPNANTDESASPNIANESAVEEEYEAPQQKTTKEEDKNMDDLDKLKAKLDQSVYTKPQQDETQPQQDTETTTPSPKENLYENENIHADNDPNAALKKHMGNVNAQDREYTPKSNKDQLIKSKNMPAKPVATKPAAKTVAAKKGATAKAAPASKKVAAKKPAATAKKPIAANKKPAANSKTATSKKPVPAASKKTATAKKPQPKSTAKKAAPAKKAIPASKTPAKKPVPKKK